jgi:hypothetical protein
MPTRRFTKRGDLVGRREPAPSPLKLRHHVIVLCLNNTLNASPLPNFSLPTTTHTGLGTSTDLSENRPYKYVTDPDRTDTDGTDTVLSGISVAILK